MGILWAHTDAIGDNSHSHDKEQTVIIYNHSLVAQQKAKT